MTASDSPPPHLVVGIGASAGGLAAFKSFLAHTPADTGMAFILVQHLAPDYKSLLVELLRAQSPIPVVAARNGLAITANCVFVIPQDATLTIQDEVLHLTTPAPARENRRPIDTFFTSLAIDCGERAVGIVLSGVGSDGTLGIRSIKEHGGLTMAQADGDAIALQGMPSSAVATGVVDHVLPVEAMVKRLIDYQQHLTAVANKKNGDGSRGDLQEHLEQITSLLHARSAHDFSGYKQGTLLRRMQRRMQVLHMDNAVDYLEHLRTNGAEIDALFHDLLIGVTQFFRDPEAFGALMDTAILPCLKGKQKGDSVRVWVPGCSTGEEVYSIAILLREAMEAGSRIPDVKIFGTDIDARAVAVARAGRYRKGVPGLSAERGERWFDTVGGNYVPVPEIRDMCVFSTHSLIKDPPFSKLDLISCRNVMIYLDEELQSRLMRTFHYALSPGGYLFLGNAESVTRSSKLFTALDKKHRILQRRDTGAAPPALPLKDIPAAEAPLLRPVRRNMADDRIEKAVARVMQSYAPAYFVIDRNHEVIRFSGAETGHYLEPSQGSASLDLFSIMHKALRPAVRAAVKQALDVGNTVTIESLSIRIDGKPRALTLIVEPIAGQNGAETDGSCVVAFRDTTPLPLGEAYAPAAGRDANLEAVELELLGTKKQLRAAIDELETRIEDMKSATEEFQAVNEELQAANEELETSKEEMQSVNEELQTVNNELTDKQSLLTRANADLQNLLDSTQIATVFLDEELRIRYFTPALTQLFPVREGDQGRPLTDIVNQLGYTELRADVEKVQRDCTLVERDLVLKDGASAFMMIIRPYRTARNVIEGVVVTFVDISERKRAEQRQLLLTGELQHRTKNLLSVMQSVVRQSLAGSPLLDGARETLTARLHTLANANALLTETSRYGATLGDVINLELAGFTDRAAIEGPSILLCPSATQGFALIIHEFFTNAVKYGALSTPSGKIEICWSVEESGNKPGLTFRWLERGGPKVVPPRHRSFGTTLLNVAISGGDTRLEYAAEGVRYTLKVSLSSITQAMHEDEPVPLSGIGSFAQAQVRSS